MFFRIPVEPQEVNSNTIIFEDQDASSKDGWRRGEMKELNHTYKGSPLAEAYKPKCGSCGHSMRLHLWSMSDHPNSKQ